MRGQAAIEFVTTYGWAFLIMLGAATAFYTLDPLGYAETGTGVSTCQTTGGISCDQSRMSVDVSDETVQFSLKNNEGNPIVIEDIKFPEMANNMDTANVTTLNLSGLFPTSSHWMWTDKEPGTALYFRGFHKKDEWYYLHVFGRTECSEIPSYPYVYSTTLWRVNEDFSQAELVADQGCGPTKLSPGQSYYDESWYSLDGKHQVQVWEGDENWTNTDTLNLDASKTDWARFSLTTPPQTPKDEFWIMDDPDSSIDVYNYSSGSLIFDREIPLPTSFGRGFYMHEDKVYVGECSSCQGKDDREIYVMDYDGTVKNTITLPTKGNAWADATMFFEDKGYWYFSGPNLTFRRYPAPHCTADETVQRGERLEFNCNVAGATTGAITAGQEYNWPIEIEYYNLLRGEAYSKTASGTIKVNT